LFLPFINFPLSYDSSDLQQLKTALENFYPSKWEINPGDGAFYGPKIDIKLRDALQRSVQCATIQLDFQLPERFNLRYRSADESSERPVIIHRAILGSLERFFAMITEHFAGKWPFWLSPRQVLVIPVAALYVSKPFFGLGLFSLRVEESSREKQKGYASEIADHLNSFGIYADTDNGDNTLPKKIRSGEIAQYNFIFGECYLLASHYRCLHLILCTIVVGQDELDSRAVNVRNRNDNGSKTRSEMVLLDKIVEQLVALKISKSLDNVLI
jgi:threonyl-tRNA synthetase